MVINEILTPGISIESSLFVTNSLLNSKLKDHS